MHAPHSAPPAAIAPPAGIANSNPIPATRILVFAALLAWCSILLVFRMRQAETLAFAFLEWNLFLAAIPAVAGWLYARAVAARSRALLQALWFALWLAFLPNAPYLITDLMHLGHSAVVPPWYDLMLLGSCAATGLLLGYTSLADVQAAIAARYSAALGWAVAVGGLFLSGFGIYLGRFLRLNSWDAFTRPLALLGDIAHLLANPAARAQLAGLTLTCGISLLLGYIALRQLRLRVAAGA